MSNTRLQLVVMATQEEHGEKSDAVPVVPLNGRNHKSDSNCFALIFPDDDVWAQDYKAIVDDDFIQESDDFQPHRIFKENHFESEPKYDGIQALWNEAFGCEST